MNYCGIDIPETAISLAHTQYGTRTQEEFIVTNAQSIPLPVNDLLNPTLFELSGTCGSLWTNISAA